MLEGERFYKQNKKWKEEKVEQSKGLKSARVRGEGFVG